MQRLEVSGAVRPIYGSLGVKRLMTIIQSGPTPVAKQSRTWVCGRSFARIADSNPAGGMDVCLLCHVLSVRGLCVGLVTRPEESYRASVVGLSVIVKPRQWEVPGPLGAVAPWKIIIQSGDEKWTPRLRWLENAKNDLPQFTKRRWKNETK